MKNVKFITKICEVCGKPVKLIQSFEVDDPLSENYGAQINNPTEFQYPIHGQCQKPEYYIDTESETKPIIEIQ
jgi:hypothetical protein